MTAYTDDNEQVQPATTGDGVLSRTMHHHRLPAEHPKSAVTAANGPVTERPNFQAVYWTPQYPAEYVMPDTHHDQAPMGDHKHNEIPYRGKDHGIHADVLEKDYRPVEGDEAHEPFTKEHATPKTIDLVTNPVPVRIVTEQQPVETSKRLATNGFTVAGAANAPFTTQLLTGRKQNRTRIVIVCATGTSFTVGESAEALANGVGGVLVPPMTPYPIETTEPVYCANQGAAAGKITFHEEFVVDNTKKVD